MKCRHQIRSGPGKQAFSLVEVAIALAVLAVGLLAIMGLFPQGLQASRDAADNTIAATIVQDLFSRIRSQPFNTAFTICTDQYPPGDPNYPGCKPSGIIPPLSPNSVNTLTFDQDGFITNTTTANPQYRAYYRAVVYWGAPVGGVLPITVQICWPALTATPVNTNTFFTEIAQYDK